MQKVLYFIRKHRVVIGITLVVLAGVFYFELRSEEQVPEIPSEQDLPEEGVSYKTITPGKTSLDEVISSLGQPENEILNENTIVLEYESTSPARLHELVVENSNVVFVKEIVSINDTLTARSLIEQHGPPPNKLFSRDEHFSFSLYVYPQKGLAYLGHDDGTLLEVWYFKPTTLDDFMNKWAEDYTLEEFPHTFDQHY